MTALSIVAVCLALFVGGLFYAVEKLFRSSDVYAMTLQQAQSSPCVASKLGIPMISKGFISGNLETSPAAGSADLTIPIQGPKGAGSLIVSAKKVGGKWRIMSLFLDHEQMQSQLIPAMSPPDCQ
jgi:hypothetical protein